jgi:uncharacterized membrane protein YczE
VLGQVAISLIGGMGLSFLAAMVPRPVSAGWSGLVIMASVGTIIASYGNSGVGPTTRGSRGDEWSLS